MLTHRSASRTTTAAAAGCGTATTGMLGPGWDGEMRVEENGSPVKGIGAGRRGGR